MSTDVDGRPDDPALTKRQLASRDEAVARARELGPGIASRRDEATELRRLPDATVAELHDSGLLGILTPRRFGGSELPPDALFAAAVEVGRVCGSTGWTYGVLAGHTGLITDFPSETQEEVLGDPDVVIASLLRLASEPLARVDGGYQLLKGSGRFCSGVDHSTWLIVRGSAQGEEQPRWFLLPRSSYEIVDDWYTVGLEGTGSKSLTVAPTFIPEHHSIPLEERRPGSSTWALPFSLSGAAIGCAYAAIDVYRENLAARGRAAESQANLIRLAKATADVDASYLMVLDAAQEPLNDAITPLYPGRLSRNVAYAVQQARAVANELFSASGGSGIYSSMRIQQIWRDANAASAHASFVWDNAAFNFGQRLAYQESM
jgi:alkylation response protein AidB-like acyl-CoA dehydrogenase